VNNTGPLQVLVAAMVIEIRGCTGEAKESRNDEGFSQ
jgi:hypothetical protein